MSSIEIRWISSNYAHEKLVEVNHVVALTFAAASGTSTLDPGTLLIDPALGCSGDLVIGLIGLIMACYLGLFGIPSGLTKSTDHPNVCKQSCKIQVCRYSAQPPEAVGSVSATVSVAPSSHPAFGSLFMSLPKRAVDGVRCLQRYPKPSLWRLLPGCQKMPPAPIQTLQSPAHSKLAKLGAIVQTWGSNYLPVAPKTYSLRG